MSVVLEEESFLKHKLRNKKIAKRYREFDFKKSKSLYDCGAFLWFQRKQNLETGEVRKFFYYAYFCKDKFCPFCNWRRALKYSIYLSLRLEKLKEENYRFLFLTLTMKNCHLKELRSQISKMSKAFNKMVKLKKFESAICGFVRVLEVTKQKRVVEDLMHPHFHIILAVRKEYFSKKFDFYLTKNDFAKLWQQALKVDYKPIVDIRVVKDRDSENEVIKELIKYTFKDSDILRVRDFEELTKQMKNLRLVNVGGVFKGVFTNNIEVDLVNLKKEKEDMKIWKFMDILVYSFSNLYNNYILNRVVGEEESGLDG